MSTTDTVRSFARSLADAFPTERAQCGDVEVMRAIAPTLAMRRAAPRAEALTVTTTDRIRRALRAWVINHRGVRL